MYHTMCHNIYLSYDRSLRQSQKACSESRVLVYTFVMQMHDLVIENLDSKSLLCGTWVSEKGTLLGSPSAEPLHP